MKSFVFRSFPLLLVLFLAGCQQAPQQPLPPVDELVLALRQLDLSLAEERLDDARSQLAALERRAAGDTRLEQYRRQLADAYLQQGREALQQGDLDRAAKALGQARSLLPQAPALSGDLQQAIENARDARRDAAEQLARAARLDAQRQAQLSQQRATAERLAAAAPARITAPAPAPAIAEPPRARLIDPAAASSAVAMPMLDKQDNEHLRRLLDGVAADVVTFRCAVRIEVREAKDYPWVAALLSARIKKLDPGFRPQLSQKIVPQQVPRLLLSPQRG
ncbi:PA5502 family lipoprotein [Pseudomonas sp. NPDC077186]|uniref:PA5502 family lipoprotein n=1 Tax=Pseudomonas sp. NPDC077186 TaxID=3364421 RepID=UPI0037C9AA72